MTALSAVLGPAYMYILTCGISHILHHIEDEGPVCSVRTCLYVYSYMWYLTHPPPYGGWRPCLQCQDLPICILLHVVSLTYSTIRRMNALSAVLGPAYMHILTCSIWHILHHMVDEGPVAVLGPAYMYILTCSISHILHHTVDEGSVCCVTTCYMYILTCGIWHILRHMEDEGSVCSVRTCLYVYSYMFYLTHTPPYGGWRLCLQC
jgi:hypothetical protein